MSERRLTPAQAASRFGEITGRKPHVSSVIRWVTRGVRGRRLPAIRQGGVWLVSPLDVDRFVEFVNDRPHTTVRVAREALIDAQLATLLGPKWKHPGEVRAAT